MRSMGQVMPEKVQTASLAPVGVTAKWVGDVLASGMDGVVEEAVVGAGVLEEGKGLFAEDDIVKEERENASICEEF